MQPGLWEGDFFLHHKEHNVDPRMALVNFFLFLNSAPRWRMLDGVGVAPASKSASYASGYRVYLFTVQHISWLQNKRMKPWLWPKKPECTQNSQPGRRVWGDFHAYCLIAFLWWRVRVFATTEASSSRTHLIQHPAEFQYMAGWYYWNFPLKIHATQTTVQQRRQRRSYRIMGVVHLKGSLHLGGC